MPLNRTDNRASRLVIAFAILVNLALIASSAVTLVLLRDQETDMWRRQLSNLSLVLAENTAQTMSSAYVVLDVISERVRHENIADAASLRKVMGTAQIHQMLRESISGLPQIDVATIVDNKGNFVNFSRSYPTPDINVSDRDFFQSHLQNPKLGDFISKPVKGKATGKWVFFLSRRIDDHNGQFIGLVLVGITVEVFSNFFEKIGVNLGEGAALNLYRRDFTQLTRWPHVDESIGGRNLSGASYVIVEKQKKLHDVMYIDSVRYADKRQASRLVATRVVDRYPLIVSLAVTEDLFLAGWRKTAVLVVALTATSLAALLFALVYLLRIMRQRESDMALNLQLRIDAEAASESKSQFLSSMSHELRTPLNAILGYAQLFDIDPKLSATNRENAQEIGRAGHHLLALINDMIDLSRIESGKLALAMEPLVVQSISQDCFKLLSAKAQDAAVALIDDGGDARNATILADPMRLRQVLINFLSNGIKYNRPNGRVRLSYTMSAGKVRIAVTDTGPGIPADRQSRVFTAFDRLGAERGAVEGTGIGLIIAKRTVEAMGGTIGFDSVEGQGSTFWVEFPPFKSADSAS